LFGAHFININFITMLIRSGIEILSSLPKLYWKDDSMPGAKVIKFTKKKDPPTKDRLWISLEEEITSTIINIYYLFYLDISFFFFYMLM
jgi:hypothetical protein